MKKNSKLKKFKRPEWVRGQKTRIAEHAGISKQYLNDILRGRRCNRDLARKLEAASAEIGIPISRFDWLESDITKNTLFSKPVPKIKKKKTPEKVEPETKEML